jgi:formylglycine-generating enzyme required for sulfatase activity
VLRETLGQGPAGTVYRATESESGREVALKVVAIGPGGETDSLLRDLRATNDIHIATSLRHPGIVRVHHVDAIGECTATEMEYVRGMSLRDLLGIAGRLLPERAVAIASQLLDALAYAHARKAIHGNLKPTNILIRNDGLVQVTDFGFREACPAPGSRHSAPIHSYAAPEALYSGGQQDRRGDIWSVGVILFQMLTGRLPFPISDPHDLGSWQRGLKANTPSELGAYLADPPTELQDAISRALRFEPAERFQNARELLNALLATGLCAGMMESEEELQERQEATCKRISSRLRVEVDANDDAGLPDLLRAFSRTNPDWEESHNLDHYAGVLQQSGERRDDPEPHAIALTPDEVDHLEEIETRLKSLLGSSGAPGDSSASDIDIRGEDRTFRRLDPGVLPTRAARPAGPAPTNVEPPRLPVAATRVNPKDGAEIVVVPAGAFFMGSNGYSEDNAPGHWVKLDDFAIYKYPVTVAQYRRYCEETAYPMPHAYWHCDEMDPIVGVTWFEACAYCEWAEASLPTEAQWEKACRGTDGRAFPWGDQFDQRSDHRLIPKNAGKTTSVGSFPAGASPYGLMDMVGNVQQWCADLYDDTYYRAAPDENPTGPDVSAARHATKSRLVQKLFNKSLAQSTHGAELRVARGSSWKDYHESFAYAFRRDSFPPDLRLPWVGIRCVIPAHGLAEPGSRTG